MSTQFGIFLYLRLIFVDLRQFTARVFVFFNKFQPFPPRPLQRHENQHRKRHIKCHGLRESEAAASFLSFRHFKCGNGRFFQACVAFQQQEGKAHIGTGIGV